MKFLDEPEKEKSVKFDTISSAQQKTPPTNQTQQFNMTSRNPSFPQANPTFPITPSHNQSDYLTALRNVPNMQIDKGGNFQFPKTDSIPQNMATMGLAMMPPYQTVQPTQNKVAQKPPSVYPSNQKPFTSNQQAPYQNISFPPSHPFNAWNREDIPPPQTRANPGWWPNLNQPPPPAPPQQQTQNYRSESYSMHFPPYSHFLAPQPNPMMSKHDFNKPNNAQGGGDIFNSPWSNFSGNFIGENGNLGYSNTNQGMSMRQAMLKEAMPSAPVGPPGPPSSSLRRLANVSSNSVLFIY